MVRIEASCIDVRFNADGRHSLPTGYTQHLALEIFTKKAIVDWGNPHLSDKLLTPSSPVEDEVLSTAFWQQLPGHP
jgi:hypothetical protein